MLQGEELTVCKSFKYLGVFFNEGGIDTDACVKGLDSPLERGHWH